MMTTAIWCRKGVRLAFVFLCNRAAQANYIWTETYFNGLGRATKTIKTIDSTPYTTETTYDALGRTDTIKYPDTTTVIKYEYDTGGNLLKVEGSCIQLYLNKNHLNAIANKTIQSLKNEEQMGINSVIVYSGNYFAVFDLDDYTEVVIDLNDEARLRLQKWIKIFKQRDKFRGG